MIYNLKRKDEVLGICEIDGNGQLIKYKVNDINDNRLPLAHKCEPNYLIKWWNDRCIPVSRINLDNKKYLLNNLALSLTDYYWVSPIENSLSWKDVSLYSNDFKDDLHIFKMNGNNSEQFTPNSSLQGELEKTWVIKDGKRILIKGNHESSSQESINEVIASNFHKAQGYDNYVEYKLLRLKNADYKYACYCECFTSEDVEFVSAYDLLTSEVKPNNISEYEQLIYLACKYGLEENRLRKDLEYQILSDYILSNKDRHMNNIGFLRDCKTLKLVRMAPIFDSGNSMFYGSYVPSKLDKLEVNSFVKKERKLLDYVNNTDLIDFNKLISTDYIKKMYAKDTNIDSRFIDDICVAYKKKIELLKTYLHTNH